MAAPVSHNTVAAVRAIATAAVTDDGMIGNLLGHRDLIDRDNETVVRGQGVHTVGNTLQLQRRGVGSEILTHSLADCYQFRWRFHIHPSVATNPISGPGTTTVGRGLADDTANTGPVLEDSN